MTLHLDVLRLHPRVMRDLRLKGLAEEEIARMTPEEAFNEFCQYHGFAGAWGHTLISILDSLRASQIVVSVDEVLDNTSVTDWTKRVLKGALRRDIVDSVHDLQLVLAVLTARMEDASLAKMSRFN